MSICSSNYFSAWRVHVLRISLWTWLELYYSKLNNKTLSSQGNGISRPEENAKFWSGYVLLMSLHSYTHYYTDMCPIHAYMPTCLCMHTIIINYIDISCSCPTCQIQICPTRYRHNYVLFISYMPMHTTIIIILMYVLLMSIRLCTLYAYVLHAYACYYWYHYPCYIMYAEGTQRRKGKICFFSQVSISKELQSTNSLLSKVFLGWPDHIVTDPVTSL